MSDQPSSAPRIINDAPSSIRWEPFSGIHPAIHFDAMDSPRGLAFVTVPLIPAGVGRPEPYLIAVGNAGQLRQCLPLRQSGLSLLAQPLMVGPSRWRPDRLKSFLAGREEIPAIQTVFEETLNVLNRFLDMQADDAAIVSLWILASYLFPLWPACGYLRISGGPACGKSRLAEVINRLAFNAVHTANATPAALFDLVNSARAVVILDEAEQLNKRQELRLLLNSGYRAGASAIRNSRTKGEARIYSTYSPKVICAITEPEPVLASRCLSIRMDATGDKAKAALELTDASWDWAGTVSRLYMTALCRWKDVLAVQLPELPLNNRLAEVARPVLTLARIVDAVRPGLFDSLVTRIARQAAPPIPPVNLSATEKAIVVALAELGRAERPEWLSATEILTLAKARTPDLDLSLNALGLLMRRLGLAERKHTPSGQRYSPHYNQAARLAAGQG